MKIVRRALIQRGRTVNKMKSPCIESFTANLTHRLSGKTRLAFTILLSLFLIALPLAGKAFSQSSSKPSSVVIHSTTSAANGGENATKGLRDQIKSELEREKPCVETMDDQDLRDAIQDERERALFEGADSNEALKQIGDRLGSSFVITVSAMPGPNGSTIYSAKGLDTKATKTVSNRMGDEQSVASGLVSDISSYLADNCKPHWAGTVKYIYSNDETKTTNDGGAAHAARRNVKRTTNQTSKMETMITATLLDPKQAGGSVTSPMARVAHRTLFNFTKASRTTGENLCREPGKNPYFKGFSEEYSEATTQIGRATDKMPVFIEIDDDGKYTIRVSAPSGVIIGKIENRASQGTCSDSNPKPSIDVKEIPEGKLMGTSFEAEGKTDPKHKDSLSGSTTLPDGKTKITWNLRLVKPKGKN